METLVGLLRRLNFEISQGEGKGGETKRVRERGTYKIDRERK